MIICEHVILETEIIGIGPLMSEVSKDEHMRILYKERRLFFMLHLKGVSIKIESDWISFADHLKQEDRNKSEDKLNEFRDSYERNKKAILLRYG